MRQLMVGTLVSAALIAAAGCSKSPDDNASQSVNTGSEEVAAGGAYYTVRADDIADAKLDALQGTFAMVPATASDGIPSAGLGGACLVFTAKDLGFSVMDGKRCTSNAECSVGPPAGLQPSDPESYSYAPDPTRPQHRENRYGYCDTQNKQCWSKPITDNGNNAVCNRPVTMTSGTLNSVPKQPIDVSKWVKQGARARVVACLNKGGPTFPGKKPPCGEIVSADRIEVMSNKPATLHK